MSPGFRYRLVHLFYVVTLLASAMSVVGPCGLFLGAAAAIFWGLVFIARRPLDTFTNLSAAAIFSILLFVMLAPHEAIWSPRGGIRRLHCRTNLLQISLALANYESRHGSYPPAYLVDAAGRPAHSWRVLLLPYLDEQALYDQYRFDEPWDGPHNRRLLDQMPAIYRCPAEIVTRNTPGNTTSYVAVTGARTAWPGSAGRTRGEILDGTTTTLQLVEASELRIPWLEPRDPSLEEWLELAADAEAWPRGHITTDTWTMWSVGRHVAERDGTTEFVGHHLTRDDWTRLWQIEDGGQDLDEEYVWPRGDVRSRFRAGALSRVIGLVTLVGLTLLPAFWLRSLARDEPKPAPVSVD